MQNTIWKLTTLAAIVGCCFLTVLVLKEQKDSLSPESSGETDQTSEVSFMEPPAQELNGLASNEIELISAEGSPAEPAEIPAWNDTPANTNTAFAGNSEPNWGTEEQNPFQGKQTNALNGAPPQFVNRAPQGTPAQLQPKQIDEPAAFPAFGAQAEPTLAQEEPAAFQTAPTFGSELTNEPVPNPEPQEFAFEDSAEPVFGNQFAESPEPAFESVNPQPLDKTAPALPAMEPETGTNGGNGPMMVAPEEEAFGGIESEPTPLKSVPAEPQFAMEPVPALETSQQPGQVIKSRQEPVAFDLQDQETDPFDLELPAEEPEIVENEATSTAPASNEPTPLPVFEMNLNGEVEPELVDNAPQMLESTMEATPLAESTNDELIIENEFHGVGVVTDNIPQGKQSPEVTLEKFAPETVILGEPMIYQIVVKNVGGSLARNVVVEDRIPKGSKLTGTKPQAELDPESKKLIWDLGDLPAGEEVTIAVRIEPTAEGEIGSVSTVNFVAEIGATTKVTAPKVEFDFVGPDSAEIGQSVLFKYMVKNTGSADAEQVIIRNMIPESLSHPAGNDLEYEIGTLKSGEEKEVKLMVMAVQLGDWENVAVLKAAGNIEIKDSVKLNIGGNRLSLSRKGPKARYLHKSANYETTVTNDSQTIAHNVTVSEAIPPGMKFVAAGQGGQFDPTDRVINWIIPELPGESSQTLSIQLEAIAEGDQQSTVTVSETHGKPTSLASTTQVKGYSTVSLSVQPLDQNAGIAVGETVVMKVHAESKGTSPSTAVKLKMTIPPEMEVINVKGPAKFHDNGNEIEFDEISSLPLSKSAEFELKLRAKSPGDVRFKVSANSSEMKSAVSQEEVILILD
ncbi:Large cysteine-rich periplasmic protein OmcB precursor [Polystyrenella longa]|uniref:Large cysteine-rich periplasmic protein OmcB n=1 Tax=Polystyrenella longa TaxID=2528007 RepID=A0A518CQM0_9PLAN|nr:DUF11 domain-containing protein [Polystyrenella longa]QDU81494.1 Large cysteine-rich periplasmic protein OmcB precursor [Polystyrenella longa]